MVLLGHVSTTFAHGISHRLAECERLLCPLFARKRLAAGASLYANPTVAKRNDLIIVESGSLLQ